MVGQPFKLLELLVQLHLHTLRRSLDQQDWYQVVLYDRCIGDAIPWLCILR